MAIKPWDSRLARLLVLPLAGTRVHPNHLTTLGLATGLAAAALYALGGRASDWGAGVFVLAAVLDHADGELARLTGRTSTFGFHYDRVADVVVKISVFVGMGVGLRHGRFGMWSVPMGLTAGSALVVIFLLRSRMLRLRGAEALQQPGWAGFEIEDILYLIAPLTWLGALAPFLLVASAGAPAFAVWVLREYRATLADAVPPWNAPDRLRP